MSNPYYISINNPSDEKKQFVLFGTNNYIGKENFGSDTGISIVNRVSENKKYWPLLFESEDYPFKIDIIRLHCEKMEQFEEKMYVINMDANGNLLREEVDQRLTQGQFINTIRDTKSSLVIDANSFIGGTILPHTELNVMIFPNHKTPRKLEKWQLTTIRDLKVKIANSAGDQRTVKLFGRYQHAFEANYGNDNSISIAIEHNDPLAKQKICSYSELIKCYFSCENIHVPGNSPDKIIIIHENGTGSKYTAPYKIKNGAVEFDSEMEINGQAMFEFTIGPYKEIELIFNPTK